MANNDSTTSNGMTTPEGNQVTQKITRKKLLFLFFWIAEEDKAKNVFSESAHTRMKNIKRTNWFDESIHKIHCPPVHKFSEFQSITDYWVNQYGGKSQVSVKEIGIFSHAAPDGPIIYNDSINHPDRVPYLRRDGTYSYTQLNLNGWSKLNFYWHSSNPRITFFGCNTAHATKSFALEISKRPNFKNVEVGGQQKSSFPSFYPDIRSTSFLRNADKTWFEGHTYMVSTDADKGAQATLLWVNATPMKFYKNGSYLYEKTQNFFNPGNIPRLRR
ncbi:hypothetical protein G9F32_13665 [Acinetobacter sp. 194]|uniref:hypothetical protein n=1 Tax=Acinetobacter shaoyimingii TaxID=2715164 RepID=UPI00140745DA|nr:hypothetical protein [Acinetobacter shaoyimingii]NHB59050.1 hypothetical protein [Acinetobacter shaoyimingii]